MFNKQLLARGINEQVRSPSQGEEQGKEARVSTLTPNAPLVGFLFGTTCLLLILLALILL